MYFVIKLKLIFGEKFTKLAYLQHQQEQITIQRAINI